MAGDIFAETGAPESLGNQYTRPGGEPGLAKKIAEVYSPRFGRVLNPMTDIVTSIGAQEGIFTALFAWTNPGDEVVIVTPCFDAVLKIADTIDIRTKSVTVKPHVIESSRSSDWKLDLTELEQAITPETRVLMLNTPSSPLGKVFSREELSSIAEIVLRHPKLLVISDEVYERCVYDGVEHIHIASLPGMFDRTITLFSAGKTFSCTGWRVGYIIAPAPLSQPLIASHAAMNFCVPTPFQKALTAAFDCAEKEKYFTWLPEMMQAKRDALVKVLEEVGLKPVVPDGGYFVICNATLAQNAAGISVNAVTLTSDTPLDQRPDVQVCEWLTKEVGVTAIPVSPFYLPEDRNQANYLIRFAFCKDEATLSLAYERLRKWHNGLDKHNIS
eukprot:gnl/MRDRNA2_/MRDRNA2_26408_c0_seq1.p1 gnl/MRDRNA2_/MRDRNA2_26408_c0~~gnl/MRDRNA2_/MRDRNA2_26408_c0_seq1.p1  ORF type:complete len:432 (+),score=71.21 gnl/MRDRNA2_/MRDRNA2_26408_c0_seq1:141-1298(+)